MFKVFKRRVYSCVFIAFTLFFAQPIVNYGNTVKIQFQQEVVAFSLGKNIANKVVNVAIAHNTLEQGGLSFEKIEQISCFNSEYTNHAKVYFYQAYEYISFYAKYTLKSFREQFDIGSLITSMVTGSVVGCIVSCITSLF
ncbi:hypothetical protein V4P56_04465 [Bartonella sp. B35(2025)]